MRAMTYPAPGGGYPLAPLPEERNWAVGAHIGSIVTAWFFFGFIAPLVVMLTKGKESAYIRRHAVESLNFQLNALVWSAVLALSMIVLIGFVLLPIYGVFYLACVIIATVNAANGREFRYPLTIRVVT